MIIITNDHRSAKLVKIWYDLFTTILVKSSRLKLKHVLTLPNYNVLTGFLTQKKKKIKLI